MTPCPWPLWIAHRGAGKLAPENTLAAFRLGAQHGYTAFECDVKLSADGVPFLLHDDTLDRTTDARGLAADRPWSELSQLDAGSWHSRHHAGEPLATFAALAAFCRANAYTLDIEIKPSPGQERTTGEVVAREAARLWAGRELPPLLSSFKPEALEGARAGAPQLPRALLMEYPFDGWFECARALDCVAVVCDYTRLDTALVARLHAAALWAMSYTVNDEAAARWLLGIGLDGLVTDAVDRFSPSAGRLD
jgi:glycerophosphoryl diester phosphodiesterase